MATLSQVFFNLGVGAIVTTACFIGFGIAVSCEANKNLTPRAWARPIGVIKNCLSPPYSLNWIYWAMSLRYIDLLAGIPGTGTRMKGWSGPTLRTNLDGIVLLRYHALQFKVCIEIGIGIEFGDENRILTDMKIISFIALTPFLFVINTFNLYRFLFSQRSCAW